MHLKWGLITHRINQFLSVYQHVELFDRFLSRLIYICHEEMMMKHFYFKVCHKVCLVMTGCLFRTSCFFMLQCFCCIVHHELLRARLDYTWVTVGLITQFNGLCWSMFCTGKLFSKVWEQYDQWFVKPDTLISV